jgi:hypothetical protein
MTYPEMVIPAFSSGAESASTGEDSHDSSLFGKLILLAGIVTLLFAVALTVRTYMPCPLWDEWGFIRDIANGAGPQNLHWLWSQQNEHRLAMTRLLVWFDVFAFKGRNISLFVEMYLVQLSACAAICYAVEKFTEFPKALKRTLQGLFACCLFHPNQAENLTWAFQVSFILCFALGTVALLAVAFWDRIPARWRVLSLVGLAAVPLAAAVNLSAGLLIAPAVIGVGCIKRLPIRHVLLLSASYSAVILLYFHGWEANDGVKPYSLSRTFLHPLDLLLWALTYLDASWRIFVPVRYHVASILSLVILIACAARRKATSFELFCFTECGLILLTALVTAAGRAHFGLDQALAGRYQTPAMLYWACISSLALAALWRRWPAQLHVAQVVALLAISCHLLLYPVYWRVWAMGADSRSNACAAIISGHYDASATQMLYPGIIENAAAMLRSIWK